jgi:hypothetical protein
LRDGQDAVAVQIAKRREAHQRVAAMTACQHHADLQREVEAALEHAAHATELAPGHGQLLAPLHAALALAVVAELRRLQDAGQQRSGGCRQRGVAVDDRVRRTRHATAHEQRLLEGAILAGGHRRCGWRHRHARGQPLQRLRRHVFEFSGHRGGVARELVERSLVEVVGAQVSLGDAPRGRRGIRVKHQAAIAEALRGVHEHAPELAAAQHAERGARRDRRRGAHFNSCVIARAASVCAAR